MRDLMIQTIEKNFVEHNYCEIGRYINARTTDPKIVSMLEEINDGKHELLVPWLKSLTDEQLLRVLKAQYCEMFR